MTTPAFFETLKLMDGRLYNVDLHLERMLRTMRHFFPHHPPPSPFPPPVPETCRNGLYRCRIDYGARITGVSFSPYERRAIRSLALVEANNLDYRWKYADRDALLRLAAGCGADDALIVCDGKITDSSFSNLVFQNGDGFFTPAAPLLPGVKRAELLRQGRIVEREIRPSDIDLYDRVILINALNGVEDGPSLGTDMIRALSSAPPQKAR